jgi:hypothetical protein
MLTGELPSSHGIHTHNLDFSTHEADAVLTQTLDSHYTMSVSANEFTSERFGFDAWFDKCVTIGPTKRFPLGLDTRASDNVKDHLRGSLQHEYPMRSLLNGIISKITSATDSWPVPGLFDHGASAIIKSSRRLIRERSEPYFLFTNFMDAHLPHRNLWAYDADVSNSWSSNDFDHQEINQGGKQALESREEDVENFRSLYAAAIRYLDEKIATFIQDIQESTEQSVIFVITADHGENLGYKADNWLFGHNSSLTEGLLHVPLEIIGTGNSHYQPKEGFISHLRMPELIEELVEGTVPSVEENCIPAEVLGGGLLHHHEMDEYWNRAIRAAYNFDTEQKCVWDSFDNVDWYNISYSSLSEQLHTLDGGDEIPSWASSMFGTELDDRQQGSGKEGTDIKSIDKGTKDRLDDLGYL